MARQITSCIIQRNEGYSTSFVAVTPTKEEESSRIRREAEIKVETVIREVIEHFKKEDKRGLPGECLTCI